MTKKQIIFRKLMNAYYEYAELLTKEERSMCYNERGTYVNHTMHDLQKMHSAFQIRVAAAREA